MQARWAGPVVALLGALVVAGGTGATARPGAPARETPTVWSRWVAVDAVAPTPLRTIVVLGDSVPAGTGCGCTGFGRLLAQTMPGPTKLSEQAGDGVTAAELAADLRRSPNPLSAELRSADVITITVGANDVLASPASGCAENGCDSAALRGLRASMERILATTRALAPTARILVTGYWSVFLDGRVARSRGPGYVMSADRLTREVNSVIAAAGRRYGATYVDLYATFKGTGVRDDTALLAPDGDHPNARGHHLISTALLRALSG